MPQCEHYEICSLDARPGEDLCILHSHRPKDYGEFQQALAEHRKKKPYNFQHFVFPGDANFRDAKFTEWVSFFYAKFTEGADFSHAKFTQGADFSHARFTENAEFFGATFGKLAKFSHAICQQGANFSCAAFSEQVSFLDTKFEKEMADFSQVEFAKEVNFSGAVFDKEALFDGATFAKGADFSGTTFGSVAEFLRARFLERTRFLSRQQQGKHIPIFSETLVNFREVDMAPDAVVLQDADLRQCLFMGTDLRKTEFTNAKWPEKGGRKRVYDEDVELREGETRQWAHIERIYRELKQNYEDRRNFELARDFHYGEKEMRRKNRDNPLPLRLLLKLYCCVSGYGERSLRPLGWALGLLIVSTWLYLSCGLLRLKGTASILDWTNKWDAGLYSLKVMTLLKPGNFEPTGFSGDVVNTFQTIVGPILFGLFALALRQRLKR